MQKLRLNVKLSLASTSLLLLPILPSATLRDLANLAIASFLRIENLELHFRVRVKVWRDGFRVGLWMSCGFFRLIKVFL